ncbi:penicillin-binding protein activator [Aquabacter spiritensis]|uniref:Amino acid/amide ABC transporter substrate-binding protein (HAAT family) n=1 Tax=Aquabacter spiritensis TaxID=933073 RepID=A0A4R3M1I3_9HYPH|nr:penicillin-binding protein activator [Aquabacter spiritensis]TCT06852.1 amino acid/amide ABC transporter substrate-binding protein (HAAT family) [Aquabacter spiritensis]
MDDGAPAPAAKPPRFSNPTRRDLLVGAARLAAIGSGAVLAACAGDIGGREPPPQSAGAPVAQPLTTGPVVALILPLGAQGNAGAVGQSLRNAAELALAETGQAPVTLVVKDDGGTSQGARAAAEAAINEGAQIILGPLFSHSVGSVAQVAKPRGIPVIAFSTDTNVASSGVYLLSFLPQSDVSRIVSYSVAQGRRSYIALIPENAYGSVAEAALQQAAGASGARIMGIERFTQDRARLQTAIQRVAAFAGQADGVFIPDSADHVPTVVQQLAAAGVDLKRVRPLGTGLWDDARLFGDPQMEGAQFAGPDAAGWRSFSQRYRARYNVDPVRTATLAYDAVSLVATIVRTQGAQGLTDAALTNPSGFNGIDGVFRFRPDGTNERGLAVMEIRGGAAQVVSPAPRSFSSGQY